MRKITRFLREVYAELRKVVWPTRRRTFKLTIVVVIVSVVMSAFLATVDYGLSQGIEYVIDNANESDTQPGGQIPGGEVPIQIPGGDTQQVPTQ